MSREYDYHTIIPCNQLNQETIVSDYGYYNLRKIIFQNTTILSSRLSIYFCTLESIKQGHLTLFKLYYKYYSDAINDSYFDYVGSICLHNQYMIMRYMMGKRDINFKDQDIYNIIEHGNYKMLLLVIAHNKFVLKTIPWSIIKDLIYKRYYKMIKLINEMNSRRILT
jgi:hypothetical protein